MKCEPNTTNFRLDFTYKASVFQSKPTMTNVVLSLPMDGGVKNAITRPTGTWSADTGHMTWTIGDILPSDSPGKGHFDLYKEDQQLVLCKRRDRLVQPFWPL